MNKSIENYLSKDEQKKISDFINESIKRISVYDEQTKGMPDPPDPNDIKKLIQEKHVELNKTFREFVTSEMTCKTFLVKNGVTCCLNDFLSTLEIMVENNSLVSKNNDILEILRKNIPICGAPCNCPANVKNKEIQ
jgi:hypothetical protein